MVGIGQYLLLNNRVYNLLLVVSQLLNLWEKGWNRYNYFKSNTTGLQSILKNPQNWRQIGPGFQISRGCQKRFGGKGRATI